MKVTKEYTIKDGSILAAANKFHHELADLGLSGSEREEYLRQFMQAYRRSSDYELASMSVFRNLMPALSREKFKSYWQNLNKQVKGELINFNNVKYKIEDVKPNFKDGQNLYTICRFEPAQDGVGLVIKCLKVLAAENELKPV